MCGRMLKLDEVVDKVMDEGEREEQKMRGENRIGNWKTRDRIEHEDVNKRRKVEM